MEKKFRVPRKKKKQIPDGPYCYTSTSGFKKLKSGNWGFTIKCCPFYNRSSRGSVIEHLGPFTKEIADEIAQEEGQEESDKYLSDTVGFCKLLKCEIDDQCKSCTLKWGN